MKVYTGKQGAIETYLMLHRKMMLFINCSEGEIEESLREQTFKLQKELLDGIYIVDPDSDEFIKYLGV